VFRKLKFAVEKSEIDALVACKPGAVEVMLMRLQRYIAEWRAGKHKLSDSTEMGGGYTVSPGALAAVSMGGGGGGGGGGGARGAPMSAAEAEAEARAEADAGLLREKDKEIAELQETVEILELKVKKLEQLVKLKDSRIATLSARVVSA